MIYFLVVFFFVVTCGGARYGEFMLKQNFSIIPLTLLVSSEVSAANFRKLVSLFEWQKNFLSNGIAAKLDMSNLVVSLSEFERVSATISKHVLGISPLLASDD